MKDLSVFDSSEEIPPRTEVALLRFRGDDPYWVRGYEIFDPSLEHSTNKGCMSLKVPTIRSNLVYLVRQGQQGKPIAYPLSQIRKIQPGKHYWTHAEVFGTVSETQGVSITVTAHEAEPEDLSLADDLNNNENEEF